MWIVRLIKAGLVLLLAVCAESVRECRRFKVTHYRLETPKMMAGKEVKLIFLSDLHNHVYGKNNDILLESIRGEQPDLILIGGDMLVGKEDRLPKTTMDFVKKLPQIAPVYYSNGNHEQRVKRNIKRHKDVFKRYKNALIRSGVQFLENESKEIDLDSIKIRLTGLELPMEFYKKFRKYNLSAREIESLAGESDQRKFQILLAHNPVYFQAYKEWGAELVFSGHLHGGIVRIPGWRGVITPQAFLFPKYSGEMTTEDGKTIIVSRGLGTHTINIRLFNMPEVVVLHLCSCKKS